MHVLVRVHIYVRARVRACVWFSLYELLSVWFKFLRVSVRACGCVRIYVCMCDYILPYLHCLRLRVCLCMYVRVCVCVSVCTSVCVRSGLRECVCYDHSNLTHMFLFFFFFSLIAYARINADTRAWQLHNQHSQRIYCHFFRLHVPFMISRLMCVEWSCVHTRQ